MVANRQGAAVEKIIVSEFVTLDGPAISCAKLS
jgi:hypothetical protein